jgi:hypothetical protein
MAPHSNIVEYLSYRARFYSLLPVLSPGRSRGRGFGSERSAFTRSRFLNKIEKISNTDEDVEEILNSVEGKISDNASDSDSYSNFTLT